MLLSLQNFLNWILPAYSLSWFGATSPGFLESGRDEEIWFLTAESWGGCDISGSKNIISFRLPSFQF